LNQRFSCFIGNGAGAFQIGNFHEKEDYFGNFQFLKTRKADNLTIMTKQSFLENNSTMVISWWICTNIFVFNLPRKKDDIVIK